MKYTNQKLNLVLFVFLLIFCFGMVNFVSADQTSSFADAAGITTSVTIDSILATVISAFLGLLGIIFLILIISAGFKWMNAKDKAEEINKAKDTITRAIIGLLIVASAYAITYFVFKSLDSTSTGGGTNNVAGGSPN